MHHLLFRRCPVLIGGAEKQPIAPEKADELLEPGQQLYWTLKEALIKYEKFLLNALGFHLAIDHPHTFLLIYSNSIKLDVRIVQKAYNLANDFHCTRAVVRFDPRAIACTCLWLASASCGLQLPGRDLPSNSLWTLFDVEHSTMLEILGELSLFRSIGPKYIELLSPTGLESLSVPAQ